MMSMDAKKVQKLLNAAMSGMEDEARTATADEVLSACMTIAARTVRVCKDSGADMTSVRTALEQMLLDCANTEQVM